MESVPTSGATVLPEQLISATSNETPIRHLCKLRVVISFTTDGSSDCQVKCLVQLPSV
jgi:hypothetical protein